MSTGYERATTFLEGKTRRREIVSPEGVSLSVELADPAERATAFALDFFFWSTASALIYLLARVSFLSGIPGIIAVGVVLFIAFVIRNCYFIYFELAWQGATLGKRIVGLRVIDRRGGALQPAAIIARNLTREVEIFLPLGLVNTLSGIETASAAWERVSIVAWLLLISALPLFNRDRLRAGDLIAGTMVIALPRRGLADDLVAADFHFSFSDAQLKTYGAFELQVLEELLRRPDSPETAQLNREVCDKICRKIEFPGAVANRDVALFLKDFYTAERAFLEREQLFGRPRADKTAGISGET